MASLAPVTGYFTLSSGMAAKTTPSTAFLALLRQKPDVVPMTKCPARPIATQVGKLTILDGSDKEIRMFMARFYVNYEMYIVEYIDNPFGDSGIIIMKLAIMQK
jgi:hypothetical protein